jgi:hypothetical protein
MRQVTELRFEVPAGRWSLYLSPPPLELAPFVKSFWEVRGFGNFASQRVLPKTTVEVTFNLGPPHRLTHPGGAVINRYAWVSGLQQRPFVVQPCFDDFLASADASFINGANVPIDGGTTASNGQVRQSVG